MDIAPSATESSQTIVSPWDGMIVDINNVDDLLIAYQAVKEQEDTLRKFKHDLVMAIDHKCNPQGLPPDQRMKTSRVRGETDIVAKVEMPDESWNQSVLKKLWESQSALAKEYLRVSEVAVNTREWKKMVNTSGSEEYESFKNALKAANRGRVGLPRITIEKVQVSEELPHDQPPPASGEAEVPVVPW